MIKVEYNRPDLKKLDELGTEALKSESTMNLVANGATLMSVNKDTLRGIIRTLLERARWIPVSERLPEIKSEISDWDEDIAIPVIVCDGTYAVPADFWKISKVFTYIDTNEEVADVVYWMPLPQPPKEEQ